MTASALLALSKRSTYYQQLHLPKFSTPRPHLSSQPPYHQHRTFIMHHHHSRSNQPTALPHSGSNLDPNTLVPVRPSSYSRASSRLASSLSTGFGKGLAGIAGTAGTVVGNVGHLAHKAIGGGQYKEQELLDRAADMVDGGATTGNDGSDQPEEKTGVRASVGGWLRRRKAPFEASHQRIVVFPGWAVKVPLDDPEPVPSVLNHVQPFDILVHISGFCTTLRPPEQASRTQRMFTRMAKNFADLPSLPVVPRVQPVRGESYLTESNGELTYYRDTDSSITVSPAPIDEAKSVSQYPFAQSSPSSLSPSSKEVSQPDTAYVRSVGLSTIGPSSARKGSGSSLPNHKVPSPSASLRPRLDTTHSSFSHAHSQSQLSGTSSALSSSTSSTSSGIPSDRAPSSALDSLTAHSISQSLMDMHANLAIRLQPFFASVIPNREVVIQVRPRLSTIEEDGMTGDQTDKSGKHGLGRPLFEMRVLTSLNGTFMETIRIPWGSLVEDPECLDLIFPERVSHRRRKNSQSSSLGETEKPHDWGLEITARMLSAEGEDIIIPSRSVSPTPPNVPASNSSSLPTPVSQKPVLEKNELGLMKVQPPNTGDTLKSTIVTPLSMPKGIRIISDLDDTVKHSDIMGGLRNVFRNVFCKDLKDLEVKGMGNLYRKLQTEGGIRGCHFVSNSPFELFEPINSFLNISQFPAGFSLKLKFYGGRSVFKGLWEPAGERKARGVYEILDGFPKSQFLLFGDSAEQDLDLYASIAYERPHQVLAIVIRDVSVLVSASSTSSSARARSNSTLPSHSSSSFSSTHNLEGLSLGSSGSSSPAKGTRPRSDTADSVSSTTSSSASSVRGRMSRLTSHVGSASSSLGPSTSMGTGTFSQAVKDKAKSTRSRSSSLLGKGQKTPTMTSSSASTTSEQPEGPDMNLLNSKLALREQSLTSSSSSSSASLLSSSNQPIGQTQNAGVYSEDILDPLYASRPASPQFGASNRTASTPLGASTTLDGIFTDEPQSLDIEEVMSSAMLKQVKQAEGFRARFDAARDRLGPKGVKVLKFRDVAEIEKTLLDIVKQTS